MVAVVVVVPSHNKTMLWRLSWLCLFVVVVSGSASSSISSSSSSTGTSTSPTAKLRSVGGAVRSFWSKRVTLSGRLTPYDSLAPHDRLSGCPAFCVTTPYGSPYMIFDRLSPQETTAERADYRIFNGAAEDANDDDDDHDKKGSEVVKPETDSFLLSSSEALEEGADRSHLTFVKKRELADRVVEHVKPSSDIPDPENPYPAPAPGSQNRIEMMRFVDGFKRRTMALYFCDPDDALNLCDEMKQMGGGMGRADVRVMSTSLGRAVRQATHIGRGMPTGQPIDARTGRLGERVVNGGGASGLLRYALVPSRRELYYAATRCVGRERVGLFGESPSKDAVAILTKAFRPEGPKRTAKEKRRHQIRQAMAGKNPNAVEEETPLEEGGVATVAENPIRAKWRHMKGHTGIPVFYAPGLERVARRSSASASTDAPSSSVAKVKTEIPLFHSYDDLVTAWKEMKKALPTGTTPPPPPRVEVFNFMDVVVAMDSNQWRRGVHRERTLSAATTAQAKLRRWLPPQLGGYDLPANLKYNELDRLVFVPSTRAVKFKEACSRKGNGKARLRRMQ